MSDLELGNFEFTDRYGGNYPDPATMCKGPCEGMGRYPLHLDGTESEYEREQWRFEEAGSPTDDGYHFIVCWDCKGTGKRAA